MPGAPAGAEHDAGSGIPDIGDSGRFPPLDVAEYERARPDGMSAPHAEPPPPAVERHADFEQLSFEPSDVRPAPTPPRPPIAPSPYATPSPAPATEAFDVHPAPPAPAPSAPPQPAPWSPPAAAVTAPAPSSVPAPEVPAVTPPAGGTNRGEGTLP
jgi:protein TonB